MNFIGCCTWCLETHTHTHTRPYEVVGSISAVYVISSASKWQTNKTASIQQKILERLLTALAIRQIHIIFGPVLFGKENSSFTVK